MSYERLIRIRKYPSIDPEGRMAYIWGALWEGCIGQIYMGYNTGPWMLHYPNNEDWIPFMSLTGDDAKVIRPHIEELPFIKIDKWDIQGIASFRLKDASRSVALGEYRKLWSSLLADINQIEAENAS